QDGAGDVCRSDGGCVLAGVGAKKGGKCGIWSWRENGCTVLHSSLKRGGKEPPVSSGGKEQPVYSGGKDQQVSSGGKEQPVSSRGKDQQA
nr:hypothetical protein [Tanacetum cinerariifolium]